MPTYEYRCPEGHDFENFVLKMSDAKGELACPICGKVAARRVSAGSGFVFKGSGFYITDYGKDGKKDQRTAAKAASEAASATTTSGTSAGTPAAPATVAAPASVTSSTSKPEPTAKANPTPKSGPEK